MLCIANTAATPASPWLRRILPFILPCLFLVPAMSASSVNAADGVTAPAATAGRQLRHVVLFKFKETSTPADVKTIVDAFRGLPARIKEIKGFEWGTNVSPEGKSEGLTHCFLVTFASEADRDAYLPHPAHKEFVAIVGPHVEKVCVVDYWTQL